jgi:membrane protease YdiL (CAAX protease family)
LKAKLAHLSQYPAPVRIIIFALILVGLWLPFAIPLYQVIKDPNLVSIVTMVILYGLFLVLVQVWGKRVYHQPNLLQRYGLVLSRQSGVEFLEGFAIGCASCFVLFGSQAWLGWVVWQPANSVFPRIMVEGLLVAIGVCLAEELVFRGWLLDELQRDYNAIFSRWLNAGIFASLHFIKPLSELIPTLPQFPGLLLLGLTLIWAKGIGRYSPAGQYVWSLDRPIFGRLSLPIGLHGGLVWSYYLVKVGQLSQYTGAVPEWVTGINGNPLSGIMGLCFMTVLMLAMRQLALTVYIKGE